MKGTSVTLAAIMMALTGCHELEETKCNDVEKTCAEYCHLVEICANSGDAWMSQDCAISCPAELGSTGYGSWVAGWLGYCIKQSSCGIFDGDSGCIMDWYYQAEYSCDGYDWLVKKDGCTDRIDCVEFCQKEKHMNTAGCGAKSDEIPAICICTDHPENY